MQKKRADGRDLSEGNKNINIDLQLNLLYTWTKFNVADYYQNIFLLHLDQLTPTSAEQLIKKEIAQTLEKKSPYFQLLRLEKQRNKIINKLKQLLTGAEQHQTQQLLNQICLQIKQLREINLITAQHIFKMKNIYQCDNYQSLQKQVEYYDSILHNLDKDNEFLRDSILCRDLQFDQGYDPFLMHEYERIHRSRDDSINSAIKQLFDITISYTYRLMKTKNLILKVRAQANRGNSVSANDIKLPSADRLKQNYSNFQRKKNQPKSNSSYVQSVYEDAKMPVRKSLPFKLEPLPLYPSTQAKSRTTVQRDRQREDRPQTSFMSGINQKLRSKQTRRQLNPPSRTEISYSDIKPQKKQTKYPKLYYRFQPKKSLDLSRKLKDFKTPLNEDSDRYTPITQKDQKQIVKPYKYKATVGQIYKSIKLDPVNRSRQQRNKARIRTSPTENPFQNNYNPYVKDIYKLNGENNQKHKPLAKKFQRFDQPHIVKPIITSNEVDNNQPIEYNPKQKQIVHYNPIKKQEYKSYEAQPKKSKYDFTPPKVERLSPKFKNQPQSQSQDSENGLNYQDPISKYNLNKKKKAKKQKSDQESQTIQVRKQEKQLQQQVPKKRKVLNTDSDQTLQDQNIVDQRIKRSLTGPVIRSLKKSQNLSQPQKKQPQKTVNTNDNKKQIKMRVGKATIEETIQLLKKYKIKNEYLNAFDLQRTIAWIRANQTYLTQFLINDQTAVIALCSPIPNLGTALIFWASVDEQLDFYTCSNLFKKYIDFIQKQAIDEKIVFSGKPFKELAAGQFIMRKQNYYQRIRQTASTGSKRQFQPFVYIECSNLKFANNGKKKRLFSQDIEQFTKENSTSASFLAEVTNNVPHAIRPLIKFDSNLQNFKQVNQILTRQNFDNYEASQIQASNIQLIRFYLNTSLQSSFIAQDNYFKFLGTVLHQKDRECVLSVGLVKNNGFMYFGKNVSFSSMLQITKRSPISNPYFTVRMFNKKLYGKMPEAQGNSYGNWQINLTWQDQIQGKIKHNMKQSISFGPQNFKVLFEFQRVVLLGLQVNKQDFI